MTEENGTRDLFSALPAELSEMILTYLPAEDLASAGAVSKSWFRIANSEFLWKNVCSRDRILEEKLIDDFFDKVEEQRCRWARLYQYTQRRSKRWKSDKYRSINTPKILTAFVHGVTLLVGTNDGVGVHCIEGSHLVVVQHLKTGIPTTSITAVGDTLVCGDGTFSFVYTLKGRTYQLESTLSPPDDLVLTGPPVITEKKSEGVSLNVFVITDDFIWIGVSECNVMTCCKVFDRAGKSFSNVTLHDLVTVRHNRSYVSVLRPCGVQVYSDSGLLAFKLDSCAFYTGLVMSEMGIAFLQCQDFGDPEPVFFDLHRKTCSVENRFKVYKLALFEDNLLYLTGQVKFTMVSLKADKTRWVTPLAGSKYLRPGKDRFHVLCRKFVFICPSRGRLDMFSLFDLETGVNFYDTSIYTATYNILQVADTGFLYKSDKSAVKLRSYI
ncbi:uncharacterized protein LOC106670861 [Cimex lectularius]|uniref:F-box domain-containing protein n=1 Tax=Cimex lectularius TaxID=79782 RepID=A0A8I6S6G8_CIMLE|nr:uncharacterized protein LOC106670861 [Cimex lectularius]